MPVIKASADLRNKYSDISNYCHTTNEPIFITKNGQGDLAVMSIEHYDNMRPSKGRGTGTVPFLLQTGFEHLKIYQHNGGYKNEQTSKVKWY